MSEETEIEVAQEELPVPAKQEYEGTDESAMETAKRRMAERDAEYKAKFAELTSSKSDSKPKARQKPSPANVNYSNEGRSVPSEKVAESNYSNEGKSVPVKKEPKQDYSNEGKSVPEMKSLESGADYSNEGRSVPSPIVNSVEAGAEDKDVSFGKVSKGSGLRGLRGGTSVPSDREAYSSAWKKLK